VPVVAVVVAVVVATEIETPTMSSLDTAAPTTTPIVSVSVITETLSSTLSLNIAAITTATATITAEKLETGVSTLSTTGEIMHQNIDSVIAQNLEKEAISIRYSKKDLTKDSSQITTVAALVIEESIPSSTGKLIPPNVDPEKEAISIRDSKKDINKDLESQITRSEVDDIIKKTEFIRFGELQVSVRVGQGQGR
jgi:hypothetical protein